MNFTSGNATDFVVGTTCFPNGKPRSLTHGQTCLIEVRFVPRGAGYRKVKVRIFYDGSGSPQVLTLTGIATEGYYLAAAARRCRDASATRCPTASGGQLSLAAPIIGMAATARGYGILASRIRRRDLLVRQREVLRLDRCDASQSAGRRHGAACPMAPAIGSSRPMAGSSRSARRSSTARPAGSASTSRSSGWR